MKYGALALLLLAGCTQPKPAPPAKPTPAYFKTDPATAAGVKGAVLYKGKAATKKLSMDAEAACQDLHETPAEDRLIIVGKDGTLANAFVYIKSGLEGKQFEPPAEAVVLDQRGCQFIPRVVALRTRQTLRIRNSDPVSHNIHPMPKNNRDWNQQQPPKSEDIQRRFGFPEVMIPVKCNIHNWMRTYVAVLDHPFFAVTGEDGSFAFENLPPGDYTLAVWHETLGEIERPLKLDARRTAAEDFVYR